MASTAAIQFIEGLLQRADTQTRAILATAEGGAEVDDALMIFGDGTNPIQPGVQGCWMFDFRCRISGWFIQEFDGTTGSITLDLQRAPRGPSPPFASICALNPPLLATSRFSSSDAVPMTGWATHIDGGDLVRLEVTSVTGFKRLLVALRIRRLEP